MTAVWLVLISRPAEGRRLSWPGWLCENTEVVRPPKAVTYPTTNRAQRRVTSLIRPIMLQLCHAAAIGKGMQAAKFCSSKILQFLRVGAAG